MEYRQEPSELISIRNLAYDKFHTKFPESFVPLGASLVDYSGIHSQGVTKGK